MWQPEVWHHYSKYDSTHPSKGPQDEVSPYYSSLRQSDDMTILYLGDKVVDHPTLPLFLLRSLCMSGPADLQGTQVLILTHIENTIPKSVGTERKITTHIKPQ